MALKDLVIERGKITEEMVETIIANFVHYELNPSAIVFTPEGYSLKNDTKVLIYLVAILGWQYIVDEEHQTDTRPAALEIALGIPGGTLRPILKKLKDAHLLAIIDGHYSIHPSNLNAISRIVRGEKPAPTSNKSVKTPRAKSDTRKGTSRTKGDINKTKKKHGISIRSSLDQLIADKFFTEYRTLGHVSDRLQELAIIIKVTSLSGPIADLVRDKKLQRKKIEQNGKQVWAYKVV